MTRATLSAWAAWAPGVETSDAWRAWALEPRALVGAGAPEVRFLPPLLRRRSDPLSRMILHVAHECCPSALLPDVSCVVASRHGPFSTTVSLLEDLAIDAPLSPARFSHSVHNTQAGLFSIWARNQQASTSVAARDETFAHGFLEALGLLHREPGRPVLLLCGDERLPEPIEELAEQRHASHAVALLLGVNGAGQPLELRLESAQEKSNDEQLPDSLAFLRWWLAEEPTLRRVHGPRAWVWSRASRTSRIASKGDAARG